MPIHYHCPTLQIHRHTAVSFLQCHPRLSLVLWLATSSSSIGSRQSKLDGLNLKRAHFLSFIPHAHRELQNVECLKEARSRRTKLMVVRSGLDKSFSCSKGSMSLSSKSTSEALTIGTSMCQVTLPAPPCGWPSPDSAAANGRWQQREQKPYESIKDSNDGRLLLAEVEIVLFT